MPIQLVAAMGGSMAATIDAAMEYLRLLWELAEEPSAWEENRLAISETDIATRLRQIPSEALEQIVQSCGALREHGSLKFTLADLAWGSLMNRLLPGARPHDVRYLALRSTRRIYGVSPSSSTLQQMHAYSRAIRDLLDFYGEQNRLPAEFPRRHFMEALRAASKIASKEELL